MTKSIGRANSRASRRLDPEISTSKGYTFCSCRGRSHHWQTHRKALTSRGGSVVALARSGSESVQSPVLKGAKIATVDYTDVPLLAAVLQDHNVDVVISAVAYGALAAQRPIADAAKEAGAKLFVPSEYGMPTEGGKEGHLAIKSDFAKYVNSLGIPTLRIYVCDLLPLRTYLCSLDWSGGFIEFIPWLTGVELGKLRLLGDHTAPLLSHLWMTLQARFLAHVLTTLPAESLHNATFRIEGDRTSLASVGALYEACNPPIPVVHVTELPEGFVKQTFLQRKFNEGRHSSGWDNYADKDIPENADSGNKVWEGHKWRSVKEVLGL